MANMLVSLFLLLSNPDFYKATWQISLLSICSGGIVNTDLEVLSV